MYKIFVNKTFVNNCNVEPKFITKSTRGLSTAGRSSHVSDLAAPDLSRPHGLRGVRECYGTFIQIIQLENLQGLFRCEHKQL